ncbi:SDR family NAD(P)-dependent oxidoreductase [Tateyamaria omphalii]|uniref:Short-chain dehydrogenase n=1 Tax=Tateyamaria omphalii TaxID=299262 RepID=A0A1P8MVT6_9RHOB|nr:SDR family NAD(P)-dependent oxidoreductase [Tateyamaria omphalii]APX12059.1 short-chain dehydrogenase [Tateyamaria omphalii]
MPDVDTPRKIALVTGGGTGIGKATALRLAATGAHVIITGRRAAALDTAVAEIEANGLSAQAIVNDVTDLDAVADLHGRILAEHGRLDIAFNNAGYRETRADLCDQTFDTYARVFDTNVRGILACLHHQIAAMRAQGAGAIVVNASVSGMRNPNPGFALYSASKAAVISMARSAAMEEAQHGVRINVVAPGRVVTDMIMEPGIDLDAVAATLPLRRMGTPEEVAEAVHWLTSDAAAYVVGHVLCVDGGFMAS